MCPREVIFICRPLLNSGTSLLLKSLVVFEEVVERGGAAYADRFRTSCVSFFFSWG